MNISSWENLKPFSHKKATDCRAKDDSQKFLIMLYNVIPEIFTICNLFFKISTQWLIGRNGPWIYPDYVL